jgi:flagellar protein FliL
MGSSSTTWPFHSDEATVAANTKTEESVAPEDEPENRPEKRRGSMVQSIAAFAVLTVVAAGSGTLLGFHLVGSVETAVKNKAAEDKPPLPQPLYPTGTGLLKVPPVIANLASPQDVWVRVEASIIIADAEVAGTDVLAGEIAEDILAYLRTVSLEQIEGPSGLLHLHEDLNDRVAIRSNDQVRELIIETLVVQ